MLKSSLILTGFIFSAQMLGPQAAFANPDVEAAVRASFAETPIMIRVAECESKFRQFTDNGNVLHGGWEGKMVGVFQIYGDIHRETSASLGFNIDTLQGNISYAQYLYAKQGTDPWISSFPCWNDKSAEGTASAGTQASVSAALESLSPSTITSSLSFGMIDPQVILLQQLLNSLGFTIAPSGPGSPGQETTKFGALTRDAVRRFQCAKMIVCAGDEYSNGYGFVGPRTRQELLMLSQNSSPGAQVIATPMQSTNRSEEIAALKAQIATLQKRLAELEAEEGH